VCALCLYSVPPARAATVDQNNGGASTGAAGFYGESFITPAGTSFNNIVFTFLTNHPTDDPFALGTGFLLSSQYLGTPAALSNATPGFLGQATASGNLYTFAPSLTLSPSTTYFFYENSAVPATNGSNSIWGGNADAGRQFYYTNSSASNFSPQGAAANFRVTGSAVPEPSTSALLLSVGLASLFVVCRSRGADNRNDERA
jgi:hypothetical protein